MKIKPVSDNYRQWIACVPEDGDLIFLSKKKFDLFANQPFKILTREQVKNQGLSIWTLNLRSWYGYALNSAEHCVSLPKGAIESFDENLKSELFDEQHQFNLSTILEGRWITSCVWSRFSEDEKISVLQSWFIKNEVSVYESIEFSELPIDARSELSRIGYDRLINRFQNISGPNCFAAVAGALEGNADISGEWMHWPELERRLHSKSFQPVQGDPRIGDVLIFEKNETPIHAGYCLGKKLYFEKPGQDFYEPYRIAKLDEWSAAWPDSQLHMWRKIE